MAAATLDAEVRSKVPGKLKRAITRDLRARNRTLPPYRRKLVEADVVREILGKHYGLPLNGSAAND